MLIFVNGKQCVWARTTADYYDIVRLARDDARDPTMGWTVTYFWQGKARGQRHGTMSPDKKPIKVADGMIFTAAITGYA